VTATSARPAPPIERAPGTITVRTVLLVVGVLLCASGVLDFVSSTRVDVATKTWPVDFDINWVAARRLVDGDPLYDWKGSRLQGERIVHPSMRLTGHDPFSSYIGSPPVALSHVPFLGFDNHTAAQLFRFVSLLMMLTAIALTAWSLSPPARAPAMLIGFGVFFWTFPMVKALALGQGTGMVMLSLAFGFWGVARERWTVAGIGLGIAAVLKLSPVLLLVYLVLRGRRKVVVPAVVTGVVCLVASAVIGRAGDLLTWVSDVSPQASKGTISAWNQSLVGALARLTTSHTDLSLRVGPGAWYLLAYVIWIGAVLGLCRAQRGRALDPLELGTLLLVVLLAGPLTWDHYFAWVAIPVVLLADPARWKGRRPVETAALVTASTAAVLLLRKGVQLPPPSVVRADWWSRVATDHYAIAALLLVAVSVWVLVRPVAAEGATTECDDGRAAPLGAAREVVAGGVHRRG
jgi:alpha-1,2-mannosyltransferase